MGRHISDTCTMCWEIYNVHPQSGRMLFLDALRLQATAYLRQASAALGTLAFDVIADKHTYIDR